MIKLIYRIVFSVVIRSWETEDGSPKTGDGRQKTEDRRRKTEDRRPKLEDGSWKTEDGRPMTEDGRPMTEDGSLTNHLSPIKYKQMKKDKFKAIRPFKNKEVKDIINKLWEEPNFQAILSRLYPDKELSEIKLSLQQISTVKDFQHDVIYYYLRNVVGKTISNLTYSGLEHLNPNKPYLFMSNHRDIVLDPALMNTILVDNHFETTQIAIGSNLLIFPWIEMLVKLNKSFVVKRNLPTREMLEASQELSAYIKRRMIKKHNSIWIAQKEGRTKDGNDFTHSGLLKMLHLASKKPLSEYIKKLKLVPVSISYEIEPCDKLKAQEIYIKSTHGTYKKTPEDDLMSMAGGLHNFKGNIHFHFGKPLKKELKELNKIAFKNDQYVHLAKIIDDQIHKNYKLFANNYIAYDIKTKGSKFEDKYTNEQYEKFTNHMNAQISTIEGDEEMIKETFLNIYANPVVNQYKL